MDLDSFFADYRKFKARVLPMVEDWERAKVEPEMSDELKAQIFAPLSAEAVAAQSRPIAAAPSAGAGPVPLSASAPTEPVSEPVGIVPGAAPQSGLTAGPTIQQWVAAGYKASNYPPSPYASSSSAEDVAAAVAAEKAAEAEKAPADPPLQSASEPAVHLET